MELLVSMVVVAVLLVVLLGITSESSKTWRRSMQKKDAFVEARVAFDEMIRTISQATLNIYWGYRVDAEGMPVGYGRESELHFVCGRSRDLLSSEMVDSSALFFQAPLGKTLSGSYRSLDGAVNALGYFVEQAADPLFAPLPAWMAPMAKISSRLIRWQEPTEQFGVYKLTSGSPGSTSRSWIEISSSTAAVANHVLAFYVVASYLNEDGEKVLTFEYDSRDPAVPEMFHQLPLSLKVSLLVTDEVSAARLGSPLELPDVWDDPAGLDLVLRDFVGELSMPDGARPPLNCRVLSAEIPLIGSRWSGG